MPFTAGETPPRDRPRLFTASVPAVPPRDNTLRNTALRQQPVPATHPHTHMGHRACGPWAPPDSNYSDAMVRIYCQARAPPAGAALAPVATAVAVHEEAGAREVWAAAQRACAPFRRYRLAGGALEIRGLPRARETSRLRLRERWGGPGQAACRKSLDMAFAGESARKYDGFCQWTFFVVPAASARSSERGGRPGASQEARRRLNTRDVGGGARGQGRESGERREEDRIGAYAGRDSQTSRRELSRVASVRGSRRFFAAGASSGVLEKISDLLGEGQHQHRHRRQHHHHHHHHGGKN